MGFRTESMNRTSLGFRPNSYKFDKLTAEFHSQNFADDDNDYGAIQASFDLAQK